MGLSLEFEETAPQKVDRQNTEVLSDGHFRLERIRLRTETFAGEMSRPVTREVLRSGRAAAVLLYDARADKVVLIEQFRPGAYLNGLSSAWLLECIAGMVDEGESPETAARREVEEETGCKVGRMNFIGEYLTSPGITDELVSLFIGAVNAADAGGVHGKALEAEDIRTRVLKVEDALALIDEGRAVNIVTQLALLWFARHGVAVRQSWLATEPGTSDGHHENT